MDNDEFESNQELRIGIASTSQERLSQLRGRLEKSGLHVVVDMDLSKHRLIRFDSEIADVLMVDLEDEDEEQDLDLLETLTDDTKVEVPVIFYDGADADKDAHWDTKLARKLKSMVPAVKKAKAPATQSSSERIKKEVVEFAAVSHSITPMVELDDYIDSSFDTPLTAKKLEPLDIKIGELLIVENKLKADDLKKALIVQEESEKRELLGNILVRLGMITEQNMAEMLSKQMGLPLATANNYPETPVLKGLMSEKFLKDKKIILMADEPKSLVVVMANPQNEYLLDAIAMATDKDVTAWIGLPSEIEAAFERLYGSKSAMGQLVEDIGGGGDGDDTDDIEKLKDLASEAPVIRLVNLLITRAVEMRASDIHIEPFENRLKIRYRVDGVMREVESPPARLCAAVISRLKIMSKLNIAERRLPQDGRIQVRAHGKEIDLRVSTLPTMHGESVVMRILDKESVVLDFKQLGYTDEILAKFNKLIAMPHGILLVTGPTGSGKTTSLYAALSSLNTEERKILTVEDPIEFQLEGINQIQVKSSIGLTFSGALRAIVRQDPDVIMIGETRDLETARIAVQASLTGHLVLSTLHTNEAAGGITRLLDMGVEDYLLSSTINGISAQRLVRKLCPQCKETFPALPEMVAELNLSRFSSGPVNLCRPIGCDDCGGTGYKGRSVILELLMMSEDIRRLINTHADASQIQTMAQKQGMLTMYEDGLLKAVMGITTIEEVLRVTTE